jgi:hypothetical protein
MKILSTLTLALVLTISAAHAFEDDRNELIKNNWDCYLSQASNTVIDSFYVRKDGTSDRVLIESATENFADGKSCYNLIFKDTENDKVYKDAYCCPSFAD